MNELHRRTEREEKHIKDFVHNEHLRLHAQMDHLQAEISDIKQLLRTQITGTKTNS